MKKFKLMVGNKLYTSKPVKNLNGPGSGDRLASRKTRFNFVPILRE